MRWLVVGLALAVPSAQAWLLSWDRRDDWPSGTTVEACLNENCISGIAGTQQEFTLPIQPGSVISAKARAQAIDGRNSEWATITTIYPDTQNIPYVLFYDAQQELSKMAVAYSSYSEIADTDQNTSVSAPVPAGLATGDLWLVVLQVDTNYDAGNTIQVPSGWTAISSGSHAGGTVYPFGRAFYKIAGSSESAQTFTLSMPGGIYRAYGASVRITGINAISPIDTTAFATTQTPPARTVANNDSLSIVWAFVSTYGGTIAVPSGYTLIGSQNGNFCIYLIGYKAVNAGTETPGSFTLPGGNFFSETIIISPSANANSLITPYPISKFSHLLVR